MRSENLHRILPPLQKKYASCVSPNIVDISFFSLKRKIKPGKYSLCPDPRLLQKVGDLNVEDKTKAIATFADCTLKQAENFCAYLEKHRHRILNYQYYQGEQICSIGKACN